MLFNFTFATLFAVMIFNYYRPSVNTATRVQINRPQIFKHATSGKPTNIYRVNLNHNDSNGATNKYEVWATKEAIQNHFLGQDVTPYHVKKFARQMYENRLKNAVSAPKEQGMFVTSTQKLHGNPRQWPYGVTDPDLKV